MAVGHQKAGSVELRRNQESLGKSRPAGTSSGEGGGCLIPEGTGLSLLGYARRAPAGRPGRKKLCPATSRTSAPPFSLEEARALEPEAHLFNGSFPFLKPSQLRGGLGDP